MAALGFQNPGFSRGFQRKSLDVRKYGGRGAAPKFKYDAERELLDTEPVRVASEAIANVLESTRPKRKPKKVAASTVVAPVQQPSAEVLPFVVPVDVYMERALLLLMSD